MIPSLRRKSGKRDLNSRPQPWQGCALPTELLPHYSHYLQVKRRRLELPRHNCHYPLKVARLPIPPPLHYVVMWLFWIVSAQNRTRTCTSLNTRTWNVRVYQFRHLGKTRLAPLSIQNFERQTRLELATPTLARLCSTNWAIAASVISFRLLRSWKRLQR